MYTSNEIKDEALEEVSGGYETIDSGDTPKFH